VAQGFVRSWRALAPRLPAAALALLGLAALYKAAKLPFGSIGAPDSGFYPTLVCLALAVFGAISLAESDAAPGEEAEGAPEPRAALRVWTAIAGLAAYAVLLTPAGFIVCTTVLLVLFLRMGRVRWSAAAALAAVAAVACYVLFTRLGVPLPAGLLGF
jgi:hypothetical protein